MTRRPTYTVACLSGRGIGPEMMAEASRALTRVARLHGFRIEQSHPPFGAEAVTQAGHALPAATREATLAAQAVLVAAEGEPALAGVESALDLHTRIDRVVYAQRGAVTVLSPLADADLVGTFQRVFDVARSSLAKVTSVGGDRAWRAALEVESARHPGVFVEEMPVSTAFQALWFEPQRFDVVVCPDPYVEPLVGVAAHGQLPRVAASGRLARTGPGVFAPAHGAAEDSAGQGVANPASMLIATALMLGEGLGERRAAETLVGAVLEASNSTVTPDQVGTGLGATTREFADVVLSELPFAVTNAEFYRESVA
jgi:3-isopropylmalate dehydrogenase